MQIKTAVKCHCDQAVGKEGLYLSLKEEKGTTEDEMVGWHHRLDGHGFGLTLGVGDRLGGIACLGSWGQNVSNMTEQLN